MGVLGDPLGLRGSFAGRGGGCPGALKPTVGVTVGAGGHRPVGTADLVEAGPGSGSGLLRHCQGFPAFVAGHATDVDTPTKPSICGDSESCHQGSERPRIGRGGPSRPGGQTVPFHPSRVSPVRPCRIQVFRDSGNGSDPGTYGCGRCRAAVWQLKRGSFRTVR